MNHPATFVLPLSAGRVLDVLYSMFAVGELIAISQDEIARVGCISEASVSRAMPSLEKHGFIERTWDRTMNGGRGGYWLRLLPLPALEGSIIDPLADERESCAPMPDMAFTASPCGTDQSVIPSAPVMVHDSQIQEEESAHPLFVWLMAQPGMSRSLARKIATRPIGALTDFLHDLRLAQSTPAIHSPFFFTVARWRDGQRVLAPEEPNHEHPARSYRASGTRRRSHADRPAPTADSDDAAAAAAYYAECLAAPRATEADFPGLPVRRQWGAADGR